MVRGVDKFREFFRDYQDQYVLIGGAACDIILSQANMSFRATRDFDIVLVVEALTSDFGQRLWAFIHEGEYKNREKGSGSPQFFRFSHPKSEEYPYMLELFSRSDKSIDSASQDCKPISFGDEISSLSAILLNDDYYQLISKGRVIIKDIPMLSHEHIILYKVKAWLDLTAKKKSGQQIDSKDIRKHLNDVVRLTALFTGNEVHEIPEVILSDLNQFIEEFMKKPPDIKSLNIVGVTANDIADMLNKVYVRII